MTYFTLFKYLKNTYIESNFTILGIETLMLRFPSGISNYATTYQHDYSGKQGENREVVFYHPSSRSNVPEYYYKPPIGMARPLTPTCSRPSGH